MFEAFTYEVILEDMLSRVTNDVDKREGSIIYDALAPTAFHLAQTYFYLDAYLDLLFADTAGGEFLDRIVAEAGETRKPAIKAERKIVTSGPVSVGTRWAISDVMYTVAEMLGENTYRAICEQPGSTGNTYSGTLENVDNVSGVTATLTDILTSGEDQETDDALRTRYFNKVQTAGTSGNIHDYRNWALAVPGCGDAKVYPLWDGPGTVKVLVVDENMEIDPGLPDLVATHIETARPIGATVTVTSPDASGLTIAANIVLDGSKTMEQIETAFIESLTAYLRDITFNTYSVSYARIGSLLLSTPGVEDYSALLVNSATANVTIADDEIPAIDSIILTEV
jgi:uncharacterized phage protein gp47/JayE